MKKKLIMVFAVLLAITACHKDSDTLDNYSFDDFLVFTDAKSSYGEMFKIVWKGLNSNYTIWDVEKEEYGLDWDEVYDEYYPKFCDLDSLDTVTDDDLFNLMKEAFGGLHDGHLMIQMDNYHTGSAVSILPNQERLRAEREQDFWAAYGFAPAPDLSYYEGIPGELLEHKRVIWTSGIGPCVRWVKEQLQALYQKTVLTEKELKLQRDYRDFVLAAEQAIAQGDLEMLNMIIYKYQDLGIPGLDFIDTNLFSYGMDTEFALFRGNIAYLSFSDFYWSTFLLESTYELTWGNSPERTLEYIARVKEVWNDWFYAIQKLHEEGKLGGVIIDVRSNPGGYNTDFEFVLGALVPSGGLHILNHRFKRGTGRYDYSPYMPMVIDTYPYEHATITEPIVVLSNCGSGSMSELTALGTKSIDNAVLIGTRTEGGLQSILRNRYYSINYSGFIGVSGVTPVYCFLPMVASFTKEGKSLEGVGVTPDIEVALDYEAWDGGNGPDNQLDRALEYIRKGK